MYDRLFDPIKINGLELKNRIAMPAVHLMYNMDGYANEKFNEFYWRRAEGGAGLIIVGGCRFDEYGGSPGMISLETDDFIPGYKAFTDGLHERGAKAGVQLYHAGAYAHSFANGGRDALAPSVVFSKFTKEYPKEMTVEEIKTVIEKWAAGAARAKKAGFDMVEISASAGYLICQFLSPKTNLRADEYGGSWENRTRFAKELVAAVRAAVGAGFPICVRIAGSDFVPGSNTNTEAVLFAKDMEAAGVDLISVTGGWHETIVPQLSGDVPSAGYTYLVSAIRDAVSVPVAASNRITDPATAERVLATGEADIVNLARPLIADPDWPKKAHEGKPCLIRKCVACNQRCLAKTFFGEPVECLVNGYAGRERDEPRGKTASPKRILVIGGGPAGCEFAVRAAGMGHTVTLWEKSRRLGGHLHTIAKHPAKTDFSSLADYYTAMLNDLNVEVVLRREASAEEIAGTGFDIVVTATGSLPSGLDLGGSGKIPVCNAYDILEGRAVAGRNVVVIGGGATGCECADWLVRDASISPEQAYFLLTQGAEAPEKVINMLDLSRRRVTIIDIDKVGSGFEPGTAWPLLKDLDRFGVERYSYAKLLDVTDSTVELEAIQPKTREQKAKERETGVAEPEKTLRLSLPCDTIVTAVSPKPNDGLYNTLVELGVNAYKLGDSDAVGSIPDAIAGANGTLRQL